MTETMLQRAQRLVSAGAGNLLDAAERASGSSLLREAVREMDRAIDRLQRERRLADERADRAAQEAATLRDRIATLDEQTRYALDKGRDDLAERAIAERLDAEARLADCTTRHAAAGAERERMEEALADARGRRARMDSIASRAANAPAQRDTVDAGVAQAEELFERARLILAAQRGSAGGLDEIEQLRRKDQVAAELAELRGAPAKKAKRPR